MTTALYDPAAETWRDAYRRVVAVWERELGRQACGA